jgi:hypothetical protein
MRSILLRMPDEGVRGVTEQKWRRSKQGWVKLNTNTAFCEGSGATSAGAVIRDSSGKVVLSTWKVLRGCASAEHAEADACWEGLRLATDWVRQPTCLELDCSNLIRDVQLKANPRAPLAGIHAEIQAVMNILPGSEVQHVKRSTNRVAHEHALKNQECVVMRFDYPVCVRELVVGEESGMEDNSPDCNQTPS